MIASWIPLGRNPRDATHIADALSKIASLSGLEATERTMDELQQVGIRPKIPGLRIANSKHPEAVIAGFFFLDQGLRFPDNILVTCAICRAALQMRPHANRKARKLCCFCALDEVLAQDYHSSNK